MSKHPLTHVHKIICLLLLFTQICAHQFTHYEKKPLKILFIIPEFPKFNQTFIFNQITGLIDRGHDIYILARLQAKSLVPPEVANYNLLEKTFYTMLPKDQYNYDIIFAQFGREGRVALNLKKKGVTGKLITCFRGDDVIKPLTNYPSYYEELFATGDLFLPVCDFFKQTLVHLGCPAHKIITHYSGIDLKKFPPKTKQSLKKNKKISIITVCRLIEKKGIDYSIKAIARVAKTYPNISFTIIGDGSERKKLLHLIKKLNLSSNIHLPGWLAHEQIAQKLKQADIFIHPSITTQKNGIEGIPNTIKEAMACSLPVIATYHSGIPELIDDGVSGLLVTEKSSKKLADKIIELIEHPEMCYPIGLAARNLIKTNFDIDILNDRLEKLLYDVVNEKS